ncbi:Asp23/Gls24 family envelope stress response protein [Streptomyces olivaceiscleroticus]|uniref:Asp23/Gls24 family envelope stress response protein n=1 Tax=Streptomyces olivaceiscleroticus TaxID=68245 RepID=A0ABP3J3I6_9ACTN
MAGQLPEPAVEAGQRGATRIADQVVAKIAAQAAREALRHGPAGVAVNGSGAHAADRPSPGAPDRDAADAGTTPARGNDAPGDGPPDAEASDGEPPARRPHSGEVRSGDADATVVVRRHTTQDTFGEARVRVTVELGYPGDIGAQCGAVRRRVTERVWALAGMTVPEVAIQVTRLHSPHTTRAGQGRVR